MGQACPVHCFLARTVVETHADCFNEPTDFSEAYLRHEIQVLSNIHFKTINYEQFRYFQSNVHW